MPLSTSDLDDTRRFAGYPVSVAVQFADVTTQADSAQLDTTLAALTSDQISILQDTYLDPLRVLESAIPSTGANLDTERAAVWFHNAKELSDRAALFALTRYNLCLYLGISPGAGVLIGLGGSGLGLSLAPAVFTV